MLEAIIKVKSYTVKSNIPFKVSLYKSFADNFKVLMFRSCMVLINWIFIHIEAFIFTTMVTDTLS